VNRPSVKLSDLTTDGKIRATRNLAEGCKKGSVGGGERESSCEDCRREPQNSGNQGVLNTGEGE
jgi:hypothetical protein